MLGLYLSLAGLGLAAIDPIGLGIMPILLVQGRPYRRSGVFLSGSFASLIIMGLLFAKGLGEVVLKFEHHNLWFVPTVESLGGMTLLVIGGIIYWQLRTGKTSIEPSGKLRAWLQLNNRKLFASGALLVAVQSVLDVVFVIAMVRIGQFHLSNLRLAAAVATYAVMALVLQVAVVAAFYLTPARRKVRLLTKVHRLLSSYANQSLVIISFILGCLLIVLALAG